jgi:hypothetical protein
MNLNRNWAYALSASLVAVGSLSAVAAENPTAASETTKEKLGFWQSLSGVTKNFSLGFAAVIDGPALSDPLSGNQPAMADDRVDLFNRFALTYKFSDTVSLTGQLRYTLYLKDSNPFDMEDTRFFLTKSGVIKGEAVSIDPFLTADAPTSKVAIDRDLSIMPGAGFFFSGDLPKSRWSYWGVAQLRTALFHGDGKVNSEQYQKGWDAEFLINPYVYYRLSNSLQVSIGQVYRVRKDRFKTDATRKIVTADGSHKTSELWETDVGVVWEFAKNWSVNPYLLVDTHDIKWKNVGISAFLSGRIF